RRSHQYDQDVEGDLGRLASSFRGGQIRRQAEKERAANYGIDDSQNGYNCLQKLVKVFHEIDSQIPGGSAQSSGGVIFRCAFQAQAMRNRQANRMSNACRCWLIAGREPYGSSWSYPSTGVPCAVMVNTTTLERW